MSNRGIELLLLVRILKLNKLFHKIEEFFYISDSMSSGIIDLIKLFFCIIYLAHFSACIWLYINVIELTYNQTNTWITLNNISTDKL